MFEDQKHTDPCLDFWNKVILYRYRTFFCVKSLRQKKTPLKEMDVKMTCDLFQAS